MGKPTVHDIAKEARGSLATVDRVREAVKRRGYVRDIAANLARQRTYRFAFLLPEGNGQFLAALEAAVGEAASGPTDWRSDLEVLRATFRDPPALAAIERRILASGTDVVAIMGRVTPLIRHMIARLKARGVTVVAFVTDQPNSARDHFVVICCAGAGTRSATQIIRERGLSGDPVVVAYELTPPLPRGARGKNRRRRHYPERGPHRPQAIRVLRAKTDELEIIESQEKIRIEIAIRENLT